MRTVYVMESENKELTKMLRNSELTEITVDGETMTGYVFGDDEMFDGDEFYQYFYCNGRLYQAYYSCEDCLEDLGAVDYEHPYNVVEVDEDCLTVTED